MDVNGEGGENLAAFLESIGLQGYHDAIKNELKVETVQQLKQVEEQDLEDIRMKPDDIHKLKKNIKREFPQSAFGRLKKRLTRSSSETAALRNSRASVISSDMDAPQSPVPVVGRRIIAREQINVQNDIGEGEFGVVRHALYTNDIGQKIEVAVKSLSHDRLEHGVQEFLKEATSMQSVSHSNIVTFYGIVFQQDKELMLVTEYAPLKSLLECLHTESLRSILTVSRLCTFAHQIATGMAYLEAQGLIHRDLAARNILVFSHHKVKIGDFGLSRALGLDKDYYQSKYKTDLKIPIAWCAPECINLLRFSSASDVWAFGVTMWEMFTYGRKPWDGLTSMEILKTIDNPKSERLLRPDLCPSDHYALMLRCWSHDPEDRPKFSAITSELTAIKPTVMKAIRSSTHAPGVIDFKEGDSVIVIDKKPAEAPSWQYWLGVSKSSQQRGFFNPTDCVPVQAEASPVTSRQTKSLQAQSKKAMKKQANSGSAISSSRSPKNLEKKRFTAAMIGAPQNDLRHTGHIGYDGITFGDIPTSEPVESIIPIKGTGSGSSTLKSTNSANGGGVLPAAGVVVVNGNGNTEHKPIVTESALSRVEDSTDSYTGATDVEDLSDFQFPDLNLSESLSFGSSFVDEMMKQFKSGERYANSNENNNSSKLRNGDSLSSSSHNILPGSNLKTMSASDEKMINDAIELANQLASNSLSQANTPRDIDEEPETPTKSKHRFHFKFPGTKKSSPKSEKKTFSDNLASKSEIAVTPEAEQAYNLLIAKGTNAHNTTTISSPTGPELEGRARGHRTHPNQKPPAPPSTLTGAARIRRDSTNSQSSQSHRPNSRNSLKGVERPKDKPPLPPIQLAGGDSNGAMYHDDLSDMPTTPPPPVPQSPAYRLSNTLGSTQYEYKNMEMFWPEEKRSTAGGVADSGNAVQGKYKSRSDNVSYEDLLEFSEEKQLIRQMQKLVGKEVSEAECRHALERTDGQMSDAIKYIKLKQLAKLKLASVEQCQNALSSCQWNVQRAADFILDRKAAYANDVIGV